MTDLLEDRLGALFEQVDNDTRWAGDRWTEPVTRLQRARRAHRRRVGIVAAASAAAVVAGGIAAGVSLLPSSQDRVTLRPSDGNGAGNGSQATGLSWLLAPKQYQQYESAHPSPSPAPDMVPSPAPADDELNQLRADAQVAVPSGARVLRTDAADGGVSGDATVWLRLEDGTPVAVERSRLGYPRVLSTTTSGTTEELAPENFSDPKTWPDGSAYTVVTGQAWGYGMGEATQWSGPFVWTVTPDGWFTIWTAPVPVDRLLGWAQAADTHFTAGH